MHPTALIYDPKTKTWLQFDSPIEVMTTNSLDEVRQLLTRIETEVELKGLHAVGFVSYEASRAFEPTARTLPADDYPLLWFGLFAPPRKVDAPETSDRRPMPDWQPALTEDEFSRAITQIKEAISAGETYQVNFTFPMSAPYPHDPWPLFCRLVENQPDSYAAWIDTGRFAVCSASPELFFDLQGDRLISKPMKGTTTRGMTLEDDLRKADELQSSDKERAENIMVLDMIRNDLARLPGGPVKVESLCAIEQHPTVWQMTSTAATRTDASVEEIFTTLFPCASITGAPKLRTMHHIAALESTPRQIYTGAIGHIAPNRQARFSVAIRTAVIDRDTGISTYGVGAGITWGSDATLEYRECLSKAQILEQAPPHFELLETLLWEPGSGYFLLDEHLRRIQHSATYFSYPLELSAVTSQLHRLTTDFTQTSHKIRLLIDRSGTVRTEVTPITLSDQSGTLIIRLAKSPVSTKNPFLYHKTTARAVYASALQAATDCDDVLLFNENGEVTEACNYNIVVKLNGRRFTPPIACGLLAGTLRAHLLKTGEITERVIRVDDLDQCEELYLINSVRRWQRAKLIC